MEKSNIEVTPITEAERLAVDKTGGLKDGEEVLDVVGAPTGEVIVHEKDENGTVIGWHKEVKA
jgi:hypothetical protein